MWNDKESDYPFSQEIYNFWNSSRLPKALSRIKNILFDGLDAYTAKDISQFTCSNLHVTGHCYARAFKSTVNVIVHLFETAVLEHKVIMTIKTDIKNNEEKEEHDEKEKKQAITSKLFDDNDILLISFACIYYCQALSFEKLVPSDMAEHKIKECYSMSIKCLNKSLVQYDLAKARILLCRAWSLSFLKSSKQDLKSEIDQILNGINRNKKLYTIDEYQACIQSKIQDINNLLETKAYNLESPGCTIL